MMIFLHRLEWLTRCQPLRNFVLDLCEHTVPAPHLHNLCYGWVDIIRCHINHRHTTSFANVIKLCFKFPEGLLQLSVESTDHTFEFLEDSTYVQSYVVRCRVLDDINSSRRSLPPDAMELQLVEFWDLIENFTRHLQSRRLWETNSRSRTWRNDELFTGVGREIIPKVLESTATLSSILSAVQVIPVQGSKYCLMIMWGVDCHVIGAVTIAVSTRLGYMGSFCSTWYLTAVGGP